MFGPSILHSSTLSFAVSANSRSFLQVSHVTYFYLHSNLLASTARDLLCTPTLQLTSPNSLHFKRPHVCGANTRTSRLASVCIDCQTCHCLGPGQLVGG